MKIKNLRYLILPMLLFFVMTSFFVSDNAFAGQGGPGSSSVTLNNPIEYDDVNSFLSAAGATIQTIVAALAVLMLVVGGIIYITSAGDTGRVELAKKAVTAALIGLVLVLAAPSFLKEIYEVLGVTTGVPTEAQAAKGLSDIILSTIKVAASLVGSLSVLMLVIGGIMYITSAGDTTRADSAKNIIKYAIIGLIIAITALIIVTQVVNLF